MSRLLLTNHQLPLPERLTPSSSHRSAPQDKPSTSIVYLSLMGDEGLTSSKHLGPPSLIIGFHYWAFSPSRVISPAIALGTVNLHIEGNTPLLKSHSQCICRPPPGPGM